MCAADRSNYQAPLAGLPSTVTVVAFCNAAPLLILREKYAISGIPTPNTDPSAFNNMMCTFFFGFAGTAGVDDEELDPPPVTVTVGLGVLPDPSPPPLLAAEQALMRNVSAPSEDTMSMTGRTRASFSTRLR